MSAVLRDTTSAGIDRALIAARRTRGGSAAGHVLTLLVVADAAGEDGASPQSGAIEAATRTAEEHPSRILVICRQPEPGPGRLDAEVFGAGERGPGEVVMLDVYGELVAHAAAVVLPLLLPDTPAVTFWPGPGPSDPARDQLGQLAQRRITDVATAEDPIAALRDRAGHYTEGDTDLAWARLTDWRSRLAIALDEQPDLPTGGSVAGEPNSPSAELLALWLESRLGLPVDRAESAGPGLTEVRLHFAAGELTIRRTDGRLAMVRFPGAGNDQPIALKRRDLSEVMSEELRRLDPDEIYAECLAHLLGGAPR